MHQSRKFRGVTLVELLVSCVILAIGLVALSQLFVTAMWSYQKARYTTIATERVQHELEKAQSLRFNVLRDSANLISETRYSPLDGYQELPGHNGVEFDMDSIPGGHGVMTISPYHGNASLLKIDITITWKGSAKTLTPIHVASLLAG